MKKDDLPIPIADALKILKKEWPACPKYILQSATALYIESEGKSGLRCTRSSEGGRAHKYVKMSDVREYLSRLAA